MLTSLHKFKDKISEARACAQAHTRIYVCVFFLFSSLDRCVSSFTCAVFPMTDYLDGCLMTDTNTITRWVATPIIDKLNGNICARSLSLFLLLLCYFVSLLSLYFIFYSNCLLNDVADSIWCAFRNSICKLNDIYSHTHTPTLNKTILDNWL